MVIVVLWLALRGFGGKTLDMLVDKVERHNLASVKFGSFANKHHDSTALQPQLR